MDGSRQPAAVGKRSACPTGDTAHVIFTGNVSIRSTAVKRDLRSGIARNSADPTGRSFYVRRNVAVLDGNGRIGITDNAADRAHSFHVHCVIIAVIDRQRTGIAISHDTAHAARRGGSKFFRTGQFEVFKSTRPHRLSDETAY